MNCKQCYMNRLSGRFLRLTCKPETCALHASQKPPPYMQGGILRLTCKAVSCILQAMQYSTPCTPLSILRIPCYLVYCALHCTEHCMQDTQFACSIPSPAPCHLVSCTFHATEYPVHAYQASSILEVLDLSCNTLKPTKSQVWGVTSSSWLQRLSWVAAGWYPICGFVL